MLSSPSGPESIAPGATRWTARAALKRAVELLREDGTRALVTGILGELGYRRLLLYESELGAAPPPAQSVPGVEFGWLDDSLLAEYEKLRPRGSGHAAARFRAGDRCFGTWLEGELVAVRWVALGEAHIEYLDLRLPLGPEEVYRYDSFTSPKHRRRGLSSASQARLSEKLREEGIERIVRAVLPENRAAVAEAAKTGFRRVGRAGYLRLGPWRREFLRRA